MLLSAREACYVPLVAVDEVSASSVHNVHALLQGAFSETAIRSAQISEFTNTPVLSFGATANELTDKVRRLGPLAALPRFAYTLHACSCTVGMVHAHPWSL
jgi:hypothetical protein